MQHLYKQPMGYTALIQQFDLSVLPHYRASYVTKEGRGDVKIIMGQEVHTYPKAYGLKEMDDPIAQLIFALKYDGINLSILQQILSKIQISALESYINGNISSKYARKLWYLYEFFMGTELSILKSAQGAYVDLLDTEQYFTSQGTRSQRHRICDNLLGNQAYCPLVRKTAVLQKQLGKDLKTRIQNIMNQYQADIIHRAVGYLYTKETRASYAIEHEKPSQQRQARFIQLLKSAGQWSKIDKATLISLQNSIVDARFKDVDYRCTQNYVGEQINPLIQKIHYISPKPEDVEILMTGLLQTFEKICADNVHPIIIASIISFGFVFIHPFEDGNGRLHRFLIHAILSQTAFIPTETIFPISAVMLKNRQAYDRILETFSTPLLSEIQDYFLSNEGELSVKGATKHLYQYIDYTDFVEYITACFIQTIEEDFQQEIEFIQNYDITKTAIQMIIDMPDRLIDLIIKFVHQNQGKLSATKRTRYFSTLQSKEIKAIENIIAKQFKLKTP